MIVQIALLVTVIKILFIPLYHSTDFEVHRNWLAITHNLTIDRWYYDSTSEWTLDYPPFFAWLELALSYIAKFFDPRMLELDNLNYASDRTILFQRLSIIVLDIFYIISAKKCSKLVGNGKLLLFILLVSNPGLLMVDHIHFQYNGFMYGILLLSISYMTNSDYIYSAFWFAVLLNFKHIYLYVAPAYIVHLLRAFCFTVISRDGASTAWYSFSILNLLYLGVTVIVVFAVSFVPFANHIPQIISRLFPLKRGLCHAYWAPNFWALYNMADKLLQYTLPKVGFPIAKSEASMTGGLVQEYAHAVLPAVSPLATFVLTVASMVPALAHLWHLGADRKYREVSFIRCLSVCATCAFMFGWHVHEKAILMILIPMSFLSVLGSDDGRLFLLVSAVGHYSLLPLLHPPALLPLKLLLLLTHAALAFNNIPALYETFSLKLPKHKNRGFLRLPMLRPLESVYVYGLILVCLYENFFHRALGLDKRLPFLPLMLTSVYSAVGVFYFWLAYYYYFMTFEVSYVPNVTNSSMKINKVK